MLLSNCPNISNVAHVQALNTLNAVRVTAPESARGESNGESLPRCPPDAARDLPVRHDELLAKQRVFRNELSVTAHKIGGESRNEPKEIDHVWLLPRRRADGICSQHGRQSRTSTNAVSGD